MGPLFDRFRRPGLAAIALCVLVFSVAAADKREANDCSPDQRNFPGDAFSPSELRGGYVVFHFVFMAYCCLGLSIVVDEYFDPCLVRLRRHIDMRDEVAYATVLAVGCLATPQFCATVAGIFLDDTDIATGAVLGIGLIHCLLVIAACGWALPYVNITGWALARDSFALVMCSMTLFLVLIDQEVYWWECFIMLILYALYVVLMKYEQMIEQYCKDVLEQNHRNRHHMGVVRSKLKKVVEHHIFYGVVYVVILVNIIIVIIEFSIEPDPWMDAVNNAFSAFFIAEMVLKYFVYGLVGYWSNSLHAFDGVLVFLIVLELAFAGSGLSGGVRGLRIFRVFRALRGLRIVRLYRAYNKTFLDANTQTDIEDLKLASFHANMPRPGTGRPQPRMSLVHMNVARIVPAPPPHGDGSPRPVHEDDEERNEADGKDVKEATELDALKGTKSIGTDGGDSNNGASVGLAVGDDDAGGRPLIKMPTSLRWKLWWFVRAPIVFSLYATVPDPTSERGKKWWPLTGLMASAWICFYSYMMIWMAGVFGSALDIRSSVMGLILAGLLSVYEVRRAVHITKKMGDDSAINSSLIRHVFYLMISLNLPWFIYTAFVHSDSGMHVESAALSVLAMMYFLGVLLVVLSVNFQAWRLTQKVSTFYVLVLILFVVVFVLLEYDYLWNSGGCT